MRVKNDSDQCVCELHCGARDTHTHTVWFGAPSLTPVVSVRFPMTQLWQQTQKKRTLTFGRWADPWASHCSDWQASCTEHRWEFWEILLSCPFFFWFLLLSIFFLYTCSVYDRNIICCETQSWTNEPEQGLGFFNQVLVFPITTGAKRRKRFKNHLQLIGQDRRHIKCKRQVYCPPQISNF